MTREIIVTHDPTEILSALSLDLSVVHNAQNVSNTGTLYVRESATAPAPSDRSFRIEAGGFFSFRFSDMGIWLWTDDPGGSIPIVLSEAP